MIRYAIDDLYAWKDKPNRKPLILQGARQVGKTWLMQTFARQAFANHVYINFENNAQMHQLFVKDFDMERIFFEIYLATGIRLDDNTLLLLDEIQEVPRGITALKYFYEQKPQQPIIAAGSLLGIAMHEKASFPVGKVEFQMLYPLSFFSFLTQGSICGSLAPTTLGFDKDICSAIGRLAKRVLFCWGNARGCASLCKTKGYDYGKSIATEYP